VRSRGLLCVFAVRIIVQCNDITELIARGRACEREGVGRGRLVGKEEAVELETCEGGG
jgi:hypothetical protein